MYNNFNTQILTRVQPETRQVVGCLGSIHCVLFLMCVLVTLIQLQMQGCSDPGWLPCCRGPANPGLLDSRSFQAVMLEQKLN